jgi:hypothetical protein
LFVCDDHIVLAIGRDYADVSPIDGIILISGPQKLSVSVDVKAVEGRNDEARPERGRVEAGI